MENKKLWQRFTKGPLTISYRTFQLQLKRSFVTAHSASAGRTNFLLSAHSNDIIGYGECGLPPKKPHCYLADIQDCQNFMVILQQQLTVAVENNLFAIFQGLPSNYFVDCREEVVKKSPYENIYRQILYILGSARLILKQEWKAAYSALQFALFDLWAKYQKKSVTQLIFGKNQPKEQPQCFSFYTLSYESQEEMIENAISALKFTRFIKIKYIDDLQGLLSLLQKLQQRTSGKIAKYIIDANASWSLQTTKIFVGQWAVSQHLKCIFQKILYLEQPYPVVIPEKHTKEWETTIASSHVCVVADESFFGEQDLQKLQFLCATVNIKTEKAGGLISSVRAALSAKQSGKEIMLGTMVSTQLGCSQTYALHPFTEALDVDGSLLVERPCVKGGFEWGQGGYLICPEPKFYGLEIDPKQLQDDYAENKGLSE